MTSDDEWAAVRPTHRLSYQAFCDSREETWRGVAWARLHDQELVDQAVRSTRRELGQDWLGALSQPDIEAHAWMIAKRCIADREMSAGQAPPSAVVPDWIVAIRGAQALARVSLENLDNDYEELYKAILRLPERQYDMIVLRYMLDIDYPTIATYLGITETNARTTTSHGLAKLRRLLGTDTTMGDMQ
ncbi:MULTISPECIES: RNA polymerase sigma factor [Kitasatospora]|uniref:RNA polymerase sigma factor n=1 Tax=Kitasatospora TaxID=2063 RepID=UPI000B12F32D|nr:MULTISPECIES: sigma factor-like helix-turn-helix DNA-binding protein [Kitasatospora]